MPRALPLRSLFLSWVCFSVAFSTVIQAFLTTFLIDSGYKTPIQNMDGLLASRIKLAFPLISADSTGIADEIEASGLNGHIVYCPLYNICVEWALYQKNLLVLLPDVFAETLGHFFSEKIQLRCAG
jgi:hypothetical protein